MSPQVMLYEAYLLPWHKSKVFVNAARLSRGPWTILAIPDHDGLVCLQRFHALWPRDGLPVEVLAAILNGPVANGYVDSHEGKRDVRIETLRSIPVPHLSARDQSNIAGLVHQYQEARLERLSLAAETTAGKDWYREHLLEIDSAVLTAYRLPPRLERELLTSFSGHNRPGPEPFSSYYPEGFQPALPLRLLLPRALEEASADRTLSRLPLLTDPLISDVVATLDEV